MNNGIAAWLRVIAVLTVVEVILLQFVFPIGGGPTSGLVGGVIYTGTVAGLAMWSSFRVKSGKGRGSAVAFVLTFLGMHALGVLIIVGGGRGFQRPPSYWRVVPHLAVLLSVLVVAGMLVASRWRGDRK